MIIKPKQTTKSDTVLFPLKGIIIVAVGLCAVLWLGLKLRSEQKPATATDALLNQSAVAANTIAAPVTPVLTKSNQDEPDAPFVNDNEFQQGIPKKLSLQTEDLMRQAEESKSAGISNSLALPPDRIIKMEQEQRMIW